MECFDKFIGLEWDDFKLYLDNPKEYCEKFHPQNVKNKYFGPSKEYMKRAKINWTIMKSEMQNAIKHASEKIETQKDGVDIREWINIFQETENMVGFSPSSFSILEELEGSKSIDKDGLCEHILSKITYIDKKIEDHFGQVTTENVTFNLDIEQESPYKTAFRGIWGCEEQCPFCGEFCRYGKNHLQDGRNHSCVQHRPQGMKGVCGIKNNKLVVTNYTFDVQASSNFHCGFCKKA